MNARLLLDGKIEGIGRFKEEMLSRVTALMPETKFTFYFDRPYHERFIFHKNIVPRVVPPPSRHPLLWYIWFHHSLPLACRIHRPSLFFSPEFYLTGTDRFPQIIVIHDLAYEHYPQDVSRSAALYYRHYSPLYARKAKHIFAVSEYTKSDIINTYHTAGDKISVIHNGSAAIFHPIEEEEKRGIRDKLTGGTPYFHYTGAIQPRKNLENLLRAYDIFRENTAEKVNLVIVGKKGWKYEAVLETYNRMKYKEDVLFTGYLSGEALNAVTAASIGLCYVPYFEGFGLPVLEAMHSETAVISSDVTSLPEVAGDAACLVSPFSPPHIAEAMRQLYADPVFRQQQIDKGRANRQRFSWDRSAEAVVQKFQKELGDDPSI